MRRVLLVAAAGVVLVANGWGLAQAWRNRIQPAGGRIELTERELGLEIIAAESTATILRLNWDVVRAGDRDYGPAVWLDASKLSELGFDCRLPLSSPNAPKHYGAMAPRPVYLALEYEGETWRNARATRKEKTRLWAVDAAPDPHSLRQKYPDVQHYVVCRGIVRLGFRQAEAGEGASRPGPRLEGWIQDVRPGSVFVPRPHSTVLQAMRRASSEHPPAREMREPRYAVQVFWGAHYEPSVEGVRLLHTTGTGAE
jgi:hypothetical protein